VSTLDASGSEDAVGWLPDRAKTAPETGLGARRRGSWSGRLPCGGKVDASIGD